MPSTVRRSIGGTRPSICRTRSKCSRRNGPGDAGAKPNPPSIMPSISSPASQRRNRCCNPPACARSSASSTAPGARAFAATATFSRWFSRLQGKPPAASRADELREGMRTAGGKIAHGGNQSCPPGLPSRAEVRPKWYRGRKNRMRIPIMVVLACGLATAAQAQEQGSVLDRAAGLVSQCIAEQTAAELDKGTAPRQFATVLRDRCHAQEQRFRAMLTAGLKQEGSLHSSMLRTIEELLSALREQSVADYADLLKQRPSTKPTRSALNKSV